MITLCAVRRTVAVVVGAAVLAGCSGGHASPVGPEPTPTVTVTIGAYPELAAHDPAAIVARAVPPRLAPAALPAASVTDEALARWVYGVVLRVFDAEYVRLPHPAGLRFIPAGHTLPLPGLCASTENAGRAVPGDLYYCATDDAVYVGASAVREIRGLAGVVGLVVVLGHEVTHHVQRVAGLPHVLRYVVQRRASELQADCGAGAVSRSGVLRAADWRPAVGPDFWRGSTDHGTDGQRLAAFKAGRSGGLFACNAVDLPIVTRR
jgi:hypothetical protein